MTAAALAAQADRLAEGGRLAEAEQAYRAALALDRQFAPAALGLAHLLLWQKRPADAADVLAPLAGRPDAPAQALDLHVRALVGAGRPQDALGFSRRAAAAGVPHARLGSAQLAAELGRFAEAEADFRAVLDRDPADERARRGLARAVFAGPQGMDGALAIVDAGLARAWTPILAMFKASLLNQAFRPAEAYAVLDDALVRGAATAELHAAAAGAAALNGQPDAALAHAEAAQRLAPDHPEIAVLLAEACLCAGQPQRAAAILEPLRRQAPFDPKLIALCATTMRLLGQDEAYRTFYDYDRFVRTYVLEPPKGWSSLEGFLGNLAGRLNALHDGVGATLDQSVRGGTQTTVKLANVGDPVIEALLLALQAPIAAYVADLGPGADPYGDPLAARSTGAFAIGGAWSVRLAPGEGRHVNHIHREGWLSSAFYVELPGAMGVASEEGWLQFGAPNLPTVPALPAEHRVKPEPGRLVLFPSYMWHGTTPFGGTERRLTFAFDVIPIAK